MFNNKEEVMTEVVSIVQSIHMNDDVSVIRTRIDDYVNQLDEYHMDRSREFQTNKDIYLEENSSVYSIPEFNGVKPLMLGRDIEAPVTSKGLAAESAIRVVDVSNDVWNKLESLQSYESFNELASLMPYDENTRPGLEDYLFEYDGDIRNRYYAEEYRSIAESFDDVSLEKFEDFGKVMSNRLENNMDAFRVEYVEYKNHSGDPRINEQGAFNAYVQDRYGSNYNGKLKEWGNKDRKAFEYIDDLNLETMSNRANDYELFLYGLYDDQPFLIDSSGLKEPFKEKLDDYLIDYFNEGHETTDDMTADEMYDMLAEIGQELDLTENEANRVVDKLRKEEDAYFDEGLAYAGRSDEPLDVDVDLSQKRAEWFVAGFEGTFGQPFDADAHQAVYGSMNHSLSEGDMQMMDDYYEQDSLLNVSLNADPVKPVADLKPPVDVKKQLFNTVDKIYHHDVESEQLNNNTLNELQETLSKMALDWKTDEETLESDPELFNDLLSNGLYRTLDVLEPNEYTMNDGYDITGNMFDHGVDNKKVREFLDGYSLTYGESIDALYIQQLEEESQEQIRVEMDDIANLDAYKESIVNDDNDLEL